MYRDVRVLQGQNAGSDLGQPYRDQYLQTFAQRPPLSGGLSHALRVLTISTPIYLAALVAQFRAERVKGQIIRIAESSMSPPRAGNTQQS